MSVTPEMDKPIIVKAGTFLVEMGISYGACILAIALLSEIICQATVGTSICYQVQHISPGNIVTELSAMLNMSANGAVTVYQHNVSGIIDTLVKPVGTFGVYTSVQLIKKHFKKRDRRGN